MIAVNHVGGVDALRELTVELENLVAAGVSTYVVQEDLEDRGISQGEIAKGLNVISRSKLADLFDSHDSIWHW